MPNIIRHQKLNLQNKPIIMNKFNFILNDQPIKLSTTPYDILSDYIEFDVNHLLNNKIALIFGGCLRDIVSGEFPSKPFNDIDIVTLNPSCNEIRDTLLNLGYSFNNSNTSLDDLYTHHNINEPITLIKNTKTIQLIRPQFKNTPIYNPTLSNLIAFIRNVDFTCCGLTYDAKSNSIKEIIHGALHHCKNKIFQSTQGSLFHPERSKIRALKLTQRGWTQILPINSHISTNFITH
jgi:hypothetical protein